MNTHLHFSFVRGRFTKMLIRVYVVALKKKKKKKEKKKEIKQK